MANSSGVEKCSGTKPIRSGAIAAACVEKAREAGIGDGTRAVRRVRSIGRCVFLVRSREGQEDQLSVSATVSVLFRGVMVKLEAWDAAVMSTVPKQSRPAPTIALTHLCFVLGIDVDIVDTYWF